MSNEPIYLLDADVFIAAKNAYYAFDICPGFWRSILQLHQAGRAFTITRVREELLSGSKSEDLVKWVNSSIPKDFFVYIDSNAVTTTFRQIIEWSQNHSRFTDAAKMKFASGADPWLVACARAFNFVVVTNEQSAPYAANAIKLPDVCKEFEVAVTGTFDMLRNMGIKFELDSI